MLSVRLLLVATALPLILLGGTGCSHLYDGSYCQSGPKYGSQCYVVSPAPGSGPAPQQPSGPLVSRPR